MTELETYRLDVGEIRTQPLEPGAPFREIGLGDGLGDDRMRLVGIISGGVCAGLSRGSPTGPAHHPLLHQGGGPTSWFPANGLREALDQVEGVHGPRNSQKQQNVGDHDRRRELVCLLSRRE
ncbi:hypothetical protein ACIQU8_07730 [Streptomyces griseus]|uniref:hypothetical protein n=1 Tax=Streptomyces griseus TaxID=1911 RepID=UPI003813DB02